MQAVLDAYEAAALIGPDDHTVILATTGLVVEAKLARPSSRVVPRRGGLAPSVPPDLAPDWVVARYDRVVLGSGDASLSGMLLALAERGVALRVVTRTGSLSRALAETSSVVVTLRERRHGRRKRA